MRSTDVDINENTTTGTISKGLTMTFNNCRALIVDDDAVSRQIVHHALGQMGVECDTAPDGRQARASLLTRSYDLVVTDLHMPNGNGHALCVDLLSRPNPPVIMVVTGITEPRLARDLLARGVDDVMFKPVDVRLFAVKIESLLDRRRPVREPPSHAIPAYPTGSAGSARSTTEDRPPVIPRVDAAELEAKILGLAQLLPVSPAALDVVQMTSSGVGARRIAAVIMRDPTLAAELLKLANSQFYNPSGKKLVDLGAAVVHIGTKRIGELAMATAAFSGLTKTRLPWIDVDLTWRRSLAAGLAVERLAAQVGLVGDDAGLFLSALMHDLGRVVLGTAYPSLYKTMIAACEQSGTSLLEQEHRVFPCDHGAVMARVLASWKVPPVVYQPLKHFENSYLELENVREPLRAKVELVKIGSLIGQLAAGEWEPWRGVEIPPMPLLARLNLQGIADLLDQTRTELHGFVKSRQSQRNRQAARMSGSAALSARGGGLPYCRMSQGRFDFMEEILRSVGGEIVTVTPETLGQFDGVVINCLGVPAKRLAAHLSTAPAGQARLIVTDAPRTSEYGTLGTSLSLPVSFATLRNQCRRVPQTARAVPAPC